MRDPRGVINSLIKKDFRYYGEIRNSTFKHILTWNDKNLLSLDSVNKLNSKNTLYLEYKNFARNPAQVLEKIKKILNCTLNYEEESGKVSINLEPGHVFTGNHSRHNTGKITITEDVKWKKELNWQRKAIISVTSLPLLKYLAKKYHLN